MKLVRRCVGVFKTGSEPRRNPTHQAMKAFLPAMLLTLLSVGAVFAKSGLPVNDRCPVDDNAVRIIYRLFTDKGNVAFCCVECLETFKKNPTRFTVKPKVEK